MSFIKLKKQQLAIDSLRVSPDQTLFLFQDSNCVYIKIFDVAPVVLGCSVLSFPSCVPIFLFVLMIG